MTDRKARLAALAAKAGRGVLAKDTKETDSVAAAAAVAADDVAEGPVPRTTKIQFRNYTPADPSLEDQPQPPASKRPRRPDDNAGAADTAKKEKKSILEQALEKARSEAPAVTSNKVEDSLAAAMSSPKKSNWDLKRNIQPKLDKLERRTQKAIVALLKERLEKEATAVEDELD